MHPPFLIIPTVEFTKNAKFHVAVGLEKFAREEPRVWSAWIVEIARIGLILASWRSGTKEREVDLIKRQPTTTTQLQFHYRGSDQSFRASFLVGDYVLSVFRNSVETICHRELVETQISIIRFSRGRVLEKRSFDFCDRNLFEGLYILLELKREYLEIIQIFFSKCSLRVQSSSLSLILEELLW